MSDFGLPSDDTADLDVDKDELLDPEEGDLAAVPADDELLIGDDGELVDDVEEEGDPLEKGFSLDKKEFGDDGEAEAETW